MLFGDLMATAAGVLVNRILAVYQLKQLQHLTCLPWLLALNPLVLSMFYNKLYLMLF